MNLLISFIALLFLVSTPAHADFPSAYYPSGIHPRLWLTADRLADLTASMNANTSQWQRFQSLCDTMLTEEPWQGVQSGIAPLALMYVLTGDERYAARAFAFMDSATDDQSEGDAAHVDHGYLALGYDWLSNHSSMTPLNRSEYIAKMEKLSSEMWTDYNNSGQGGNGQDTDAILVSGAHHLMFGCALYGDSDKATDMLDHAWTLWERGQGAAPNSGQSQWTLAHPIRNWISEALGGHWHTGFMYFMGTDGNGLGNYYISLRTACGYDPSTREPKLKGFWPNVVRTLLDLTNPARTMLYHTGDWQDPWGFEELSYVYKIASVASFESGVEGQGLWNSYGRGFYNAIVSMHNDEFLEFFYHETAVQPVDPFAAALSTVRFCDGDDFVFFRDSWDTTARWGLFSGQGTIPADHQTPDIGNFFLFRDDDYLTKDRRVYGGMDIGPAFNNMAIENSLEYGSPIMTGSAGAASIDRYRGGETQDDNPVTFAYAMMQGDDQWDDDPNQWEPMDRVQTYRRHFFWSGDYAMIFDRLRTVDAGWAVYRLHAQTQPSLNGQTITQASANGRHVLLHRTLEPANCTFTKVNEKIAWNGVFEDYEINEEERLWHYAIQPSESDSVNMLSVMQMGPAGTNNFVGLEHLSSGTETGAKIGEWCLLFAAEERLRTKSQYTITLPQAGLRHLVCDLKPGSYRVFINGVPQDKKVSVAARDNTAYFVTEETVGPMTVTVSAEVSNAATSILGLLLGD